MNALDEVTNEWIENLVNRMRESRTEQQMSYYELALYCDIDQKTVREILIRGRGTMHKVMRIAFALGVHP